MRFGIVLLPQERWSRDARRWRRAEELGFDTAWTYDHLSWRDLAPEPWLATVPLLAAAATATSTIALGTWVANPNFRHPVPFAKDVMGLDDVSGGRFVLGLGAGGTGWDATVLGGGELTPGQRVERFAEFTGFLDELLTSPVTTREGRWYSAVDARMVPGCVQTPRVPFVVAADGPRAMRVAAAHGDAWATSGGGVEDDAAWWVRVRELSARLDDVLADAGRDPAGLDRHLALDHGGQHAISSVERFTDAVGRAAELGFTDVATHWPRPSGIFAGDEAVLDDVADALVRWRAQPGAPAAPRAAGAAGAAR